MPDDLCTTLMLTRETCHFSFMQLFYQKFPKFAKNRLHISGESYAGTYIPNIGDVFNRYNKAPPTKSSVKIPLE